MMNCVAIDDEPLALDVIREFCNRIDFINLVGTYTSALDAVNELKQGNVDLMFIDIQMPHITGMEFVKTLVNPPLIVFTTAYSQYAVKGFEVDATDYLLKPIPFDRFLKACLKANDLFLLLKNNAPSTEATEHADYLMARVDHQIVRIEYKDIVYFEGLKDYVKVVTQEKTYLTKSTMKNIEAKIPSSLFMRIHKSYIVSIDKITVIDNNRILFGSKYLPVGDQYRVIFNAFLDKNKL